MTEIGHVSDELCWSNDYNAILGISRLCYHLALSKYYVCEFEGFLYVSRDADKRAIPI